MLTDPYFLVQSSIIQILSQIDNTSQQVLKTTTTLQYGSIISQTTPSSILDWILTFADIAGVAAIGLVVAIVYFQKKELEEPISKTSD